jgi:hypothetical protein
MNRVIEITIPKASPSLNEINGHHWIRYRAHKRQWLDLIWIAKIDAGVYGMPMFERANVRIVRHGAKLLDTDNLVGGVKPIVDSLRALGIIADDTPEHITLTVEQCIAAESVRTVIHVEQIAA